MSDMDLIIKIPEKIYEIAKQDKWKWPADDVYNAIKNGIPLSKESIPYLMHKEMGVPLSECQKAYDIAIDYLRNKAKLKG